MPAHCAAPAILSALAGQGRPEPHLWSRPGPQPRCSSRSASPRPYLAGYRLPRLRPLKTSSAQTCLSSPQPAARPPPGCHGDSPRPQAAADWSRSGSRRAPIGRRKEAAPLESREVGGARSELEEASGRLSQEGRGARRARGQAAPLPSLALLENPVEQDLGGRGAPGMPPPSQLLW